LASGGTFPADTGNRRRRRGISSPAKRGRWRCGAATAGAHTASRWRWAGDRIGP